MAFDFKKESLPCSVDRTAQVQSHRDFRDGGFMSPVTLTISLGRDGYGVSCSGIYIHLPTWEEDRVDEMAQELAGVVQTMADHAAQIVGNMERDDEDKREY
tara:strand:+ start:459 stop:761 length:303 start_codon:yes stop_codon:yes gene_type:complete